MNKINLKTIGADIEIFLKDKKTGEVVSSEGITKGSKHDPFVFDALNRWFTTSLDNVTTEFTIPPTTTVSQWTGYLTKAINYVKSTLPNGLDILITPSANLDEKYLMTENAMMFGG